MNFVIRRGGTHGFYMYIDGYYVRWGWGWEILAKLHEHLVYWEESRESQETKA